MTAVLPLDGDGWQVLGFLGVDAAVRAATNGRRVGHGWLPARVPGSVVDDLWRAGELPDPYVGRNSLAIEWVAERAWLYRRSVSIPVPADGQTGWLRFEGVDHAARVFLDGRELARHEGMFLPFEVPLGGGAAGTHELAVIVEPAPASEPEVGRTSRVRVHKSRMSYGWDFCPRMIHQGIWQPVSLLVRDRAWLDDVWARPHLGPGRPDGRVDVAVRLGGEWAAATGLDAALLDGDREIGRAAIARDALTPTPALTLEAEAPRPWWPNGLGEAVVHRLRVRLLGADGTVVDERAAPVGFRSVALGRNEAAQPEARGYTLTVNGRPTPINGWNWVPLDVLHGVPQPKRLDHLVALAQGAGVNLLRVWGGGLIETDAFYDACDAAGILVWQEFSLSSSGIESTPSTDAAFIDLLRAEAEAIVPLRRNHPSLAIWCGGNELEDLDGPLDERNPAVAILGDVVRRLDPDRAWLPTSPSGPRFHNTLESIAADPDGLHDVHGPWEHQGLSGQYDLWNRGTALLHSEFGVEGMASVRQIEAIVPPSALWPADRTNRVYRHLGDWWINEPLVQDAFGNRLRALAPLVRASRRLQADGLRYAVEANRRRWPRTAGSIPWQLNESYPNAWCTSAVDHRGDPKPAYFAVARAFRPLQVSAAFERLAWGGHDRFVATVWTSNHGPALDGAIVRAALRGLDGSEIRACERGPVSLPAGHAASWFEIDGPVPAPLFVLDVALDGAPGRLATSRYLFSGTADLAPMLDLEPAVVEVVRATGENEPWRLEIIHRGGPAALGVVVEDGRPYDAPGWAEPSDSDIDLLPGERCRVDVRWSAAPTAGRRLRADGWNVAPIDVR
jgi:beta-mannosidase